MPARPCELAALLTLLAFPAMIAKVKAGAWCNKPLTASRLALALAHSSNVVEPSKAALLFSD
jgi:hypothetical protein